MARRLLKEREEVVRELSRLDDHMAESHENLLVELESLVDENASLQDHVNGIRQSQHARLVNICIYTLFIFVFFYI